MGAWITKAREAKRFYDEHGHSHGKNTWDDDRTEYVEEALRAAGMERIICKLWNPSGGKRGRPPGKNRSKKNKKGSTGS